MKAVTIEFKSDGKTSQVFGPEIDPKKQLDYVKKLKVEGLPDKVEKVEMWSRAKGFVIAAAVSKKVLEKMAKDGEKQKAEYEKEKKALAKKQQDALKAIQDVSDANKALAEKHLEELKKKNGNSKPVKVLDQKEK